MESGHIGERGVGERGEVAPMVLGRKCDGCVVCMVWDGVALEG